MDQQLQLGIVLMIIGVAIGLFALAILFNRRDQRQEQADEDSGERSELEPDEETEAQPDEYDDELDEDAEDEELEDDDLDDTDPDAEELADEGEGEDDPKQDAEEQDAPEDDVERDQEEEEEPELSPEPAAAGDPVLVAELYRDAASGQLIVRSGDREYQSGTEIANKGERNLIHSAALDLTDWFTESEQVAPPTPAQAPPDNMLNEINDLLQKALGDAGAEERGVRLVEDQESGVKVLIGVKSYAMDEVPDPEIQELIRQAVAEWEDSQ